MAASEVVSVRLPPGTADKIREAFGMSFSSAVRFVMMGLLRKAEAEQLARAQVGRHELAASIEEVLVDLPQTEGPSDDDGQSASSN